MIVKTIKDQRGTLEFDVDFEFYYIPYHSKLPRYIIRVWHILPGKRTKRVNNDIASDAEIFEAKLQFWEMIKPEEGK